MQAHAVRKFLLITLLLLLGAYLLLPYALRLGLERLLRDQGYDQVSLAELDIEPFAGELHLRGLSAQRGDAPPLSLERGYVNLDWLALTRRQGLLQGMVVAGLQLTLQQDEHGQLILSGLPLPANDKPRDDTPMTWGFGVDRLTISNSQLRLLLPVIDHTVKLEELLLTGLHSWAPDSPAKLQLDAYLDTARLRMDGQLLPFAKAPLLDTRLRINTLNLARLANDLDKQLPPDIRLTQGTLQADLQLKAGLSNGQPQLTPQSTVSLQGLKLLVNAQPQSIDKLDWKGTLNWSTPQGLRSDGSITVADIMLSTNADKAQVASLDWQGRLAWSATDGLSSDNKLTLNAITLNAAQREAHATQLNWQGKAGWSSANGASTDGKLTLNAVTATQSAQKLLLAKLQQLQIANIKLDAQQTLQLDGIRLDQVIALQAQDKPDNPPLLAAQRIDISPSQIKAGQVVRLGTVNLTDAKIDIERGPKGELPLIERLLAGQATNARTTDTPAAAVQLQLAGLQLSGDGQISFLDRSVQPAFREKLIVDKLTLGAADSAMPDNWTPLELAGRLGEYSQLDLTGKARPFADKLNLDLSGTLKAVELPPLSSYTAGILGYNLQSGQLNSKVTLKINDNLLDGKAELVLNKLTVKAADQKRLAQLTRQLSMPLDYALDMLRDRNNTISVTLPVGGDINTPSFDLSDIINTAMANALKSAAISYIKNAIQPYGTLITLVQYADKAATRMALKSVDFASGSADIPEAAAPYLSKLDELLKNRPNLRINICGIATQSDRRALSRAKTAGGDTTQTPSVTDDTLRSLAADRAANLKRDLVERDISPDRLFVCNPEIDPAADAQPRADLLL